MHSTVSAFVWQMVAWDDEDDSTFDDEDDDDVTRSHRPADRRRAAASSTARVARCRRLCRRPLSGCARGANTSASRRHTDMEPEPPRDTAIV